MATLQNSSSNSTAPAPKTQSYVSGASAIRQNTAQVITDFKAGKTTLDVAKDPKTATVGNQQPEQSSQPQAEKTVKLDEMTNEQKVVYFDEKERLSGLTDEEKDQQKAAQNAVDNEKKGGNKINAGKIDKSFRDPDWGEPEKTKFDIQQGDIIEFMMKEIVLAAAAEAGDKVFSAVGTGIYHGGSKIYHPIRDFVADIEKGLHRNKVDREEEKKRRDKEKEEAKKKKEQEESEAQEAAKKAKDKPEDQQKLEPNSNDGQAVAFSKIVRKMREDTLKYNEIAYNSDMLLSLTGRALSPAWDPKTLNAAEQQFLNSKENAKLPQYFQMLHEIAKAKDFDQSYVDNIKNIAFEKMKEQFTNAESMNVFAANYAAAQMISTKNANPDKAFTDPKDYEKDFALYLNQGKKCYLLSYKDILENKSGRPYKDRAEMVGSSGDAFKISKENVDQKSPKANPELDKINSIWQGSDRDASEKGLKSLTDAVDYQKSDYLSKQLDDKIRTLDAFEHDHANTRNRSEALKKRKARLISGHKNSNEEKPASRGAATIGNKGRE